MPCELGEAILYATSKSMTKTTCFHMFKCLKLYTVVQNLGELEKKGNVPIAWCIWEWMYAFGSAGSNTRSHDGAVAVICEHDHVSWDEAAQQQLQTQQHGEKKEVGPWLV